MGTVKSPPRRPRKFAGTPFAGRLFRERATFGGKTARRGKKWGMFLCCLFLSACAYIQPPKDKLETLSLVRGNQRADTLFILLPGMGSRAKDFVANGFMKELEQSGIQADAVLVDAYLGYYLNRTIIVRLHEDVVLPALERGYRHLWMVGISMGGFGTVLYVREHPQVLKGVILLAPFLGEDKIVREIKEAGGLLHWKPKVPPTEEHYQEMLWHWLKNYAAPDHSLPKLLLGFGEQDPFVQANSLLAGILPPDQVFILPGRHDWPTWNRLFALMLQKTR